MINEEGVILKIAVEEMSELLRKNAPFLHLLLDGDKKQTNALILTITPGQVQTVEEIFHNLLTLSLDESDRQVVNKRGSMIKSVANPNKSKQYKRKTLIQHRRQFVSVLQHFRDRLKSLID